MKLKNDLLLRAANGEVTERPPVWLMRQAGRILPQYRALRGSLSGFKELVETPHLAAEVTIQPVDELDVDAAIIFSDILVIPEAMGLTYEMVEKKGPWFPNTIQTVSDIDRLISGEKAAKDLEYVFEALRITKKELAGRVPLIGFSGTPWTLLAYMVEGSGSKTFSKAKKFLYTQPEAAHRLLDMLSDTIIAYLNMKVEAGADLIQLFDSWGGILSPTQYQEFSLKYIRKICEGIQGAPVTVFAKNAWFALPDLKDFPCNVVGLDWNTPPQYARNILGEKRVVQGNADPCFLYSNTKDIENATRQLIHDFAGHHIVNLGHGVYPDTPLDGVKAFVNTVKSFS